MIPVVSFGLGPIGLGIAAGVLERGEFALRGAVDSNPELVGRDVGQLLSRAANGIAVAADPSESLASSEKGVVIHATSSRLSSVAHQVEALISAGWDVLSTCEELTFPAASDPELARSIDQSANRAGVTVLAAGINPGFIMDLLPLLLTAVCHRIDSIHVRRLVDTNHRRLQLQTKVGVGLPRDEFERRAADGTLGHVGLRQSAYLIADRLGWGAAHYEEQLAPVVATRESQTPMGPVPAGGVLGQRQTATLRSAGQTHLRLELEMFAGATAEDRIEIDGDPPIVQVIPSGVDGDRATTALLCNLVSQVREARPGLLTMPDLLPLAWNGNRRDGE